ncbi:hypothetical protein CAEBREN_00234 [Caenorhabditis brenneri]|uniref:Uncharacterized protein n=1 Tax=Caenorhabditis brenneri TaxID=135651 RepID=G0NLU1_CAEBE|nr:hypothetical protein CAEBREN_00234 [Caenorhabditis brenneri]
MPNSKEEGRAAGRYRRHVGRRNKFRKGREGSSKPRNGEIESIEVCSFSKIAEGGRRLAQFSLYPNEKWLNCSIFIVFFCTRNSIFAKNFRRNNFKSKDFSMNTRSDFAPSKSNSQRIFQPKTGEKDGRAAGRYRRHAGGRNEFRKGHLAQRRTENGAARGIAVAPSGGNLGWKTSSSWRRVDDAYRARSKWREETEDMMENQKKPSADAEVAKAQEEFAVYEFTKGHIGRRSQEQAL